MGFFDFFPYTNFHNVNLDWVLQRVKEWGELVVANDIAFHNLEEANASFKRYVENYLADLDVQAQIDDKLDRMFESGVLGEYLQPYVSPTVTRWLDENITEPTGVIIDSSLTVAGACADAKATGERIDSATGLSLDAKIALLNCFENVAWDVKTGRNYYYTLKNALNLEVTSITAVFNQNGNIITSTDSLDDLRPMLTVTSGDGREIKTYSLSGSLDNPISTITVNVDEARTTFSVDVSSLPLGYTRKSYVQATGEQRIPSGIYEPDMVSVWVRQKQCTTELLDRAGHILSSTNYVVPFQRYFPTSNLGRISYNRFGGQTASWSKLGNLWNINEDVVIESYKDGDKIFLNGEHVTSLPSGNTISSSNQLYFFRPGTNTNTVYAFRGRLYYLKIFNALGVKLHDFAPCINSSNVAGLYDFVTGEFHTADIGVLLTD